LLLAGGFSGSGMGYGMMGGMGQMMGGSMMGGGIFGLLFAVLFWLLLLDLLVAVVWIFNQAQRRKTSEPLHSRPATLQTAAAGYISFSISGPPVLRKRHTRTVARARKTTLSKVV
jgi:predicted lipid-binding transport protein (Tim44 family)